MTERLTVALEDGSIERLRELAGGERKVGVFLSDVTAWLWEHRPALETTPLSGYTLLPRHLLHYAGRIREMVGDEPTVWEDRQALEESQRILVQAKVILDETERRAVEIERMAAEAERRIEAWTAKMERRADDLDAKQLQGKDSQEDAKDNADGDAK